MASRPVVNWATRIVGIPLYADFDDERLYHYAPVAHVGALQEAELGQKLTMMEGEISYDITPAEGRSILETLDPTAKLAPLVASDVRGTAVSAVPVPPPHSVSIRVMPTLPFPKIVASFTLRRSAADHDELRAALRFAWQARAAIRGDLAFVADAYHVDVAAKVALPRLAVRRGLAEALGRERAARPEVFAAIRTVVERGLARWVRMVGPEGATVTPEIIAFLQERIFESFFTADGFLSTFDGMERVAAWRLRDHRELEEVDELFLSRSRPERLIAALVAAAGSDA
jgi:hypothetical protein